MPRNTRVKIKAATWEWIKTQRAKGFSVQGIVRELNGEVSDFVVRRALSEIEKKPKALLQKPTRSWPQMPDGFISAKEASVLREAVPEDTRSWQQRFFGDPRPGRSALAQKGFVSVSKSL